ncbi:hypothetical protein [Flavobacterium sp. RS13.1]|jgi:hypothetical protein|uniref:hypothetical protein n=1 Tax=Flavobacterium sp. RS13.1 TaxID=3400345 RepID=UPI003AADACDE
MNKKIYLFLSALLFSCSAQKNNTKIDPIEIPVESSLNKVENDIVNDFLAAELKKDRYINYKDFEITIIEEALKKIKAVESYSYSYNERIAMNKNNKVSKMESIYFLDSLQIKKMELELKDEPIYHWKISDFTKTKVKLLKTEELRKIINSGSYTNPPYRLIIQLSRPLIIDTDKALISFDIGNSQFGYGGINHFTALVKKVNNKWEQNGYYFDGVFY